MKELTMNYLSPNRLLHWSERLFAAGIILTAIILPLDRVARIPGIPVSLHLIATLLLSQYLSRFILEPKIRSRLLRRGGIASIIFLPTVAGLMSIPNSVSPELSKQSLALLLAAMFKGWLIATLADKHHLSLLAKAILGSSIVIVALGYLQVIGDLIGLPLSWTQLLPRYSSQSTFILPRPQVTALEPLYLAHYLFIPLCLVIHGFITGQRQVWRYLLLVGILGLMVMTLSRGALVGLVAVALISAFSVVYAKTSHRRVLVASLVTTLIILIVCFFVGLAYFQKHPVKEVMGVPRSATSILLHLADFNDRSANTRYELWPQAIKMFRATPILGVGFYASRVELHPELTPKSAASAQPFNNSFLSYVTEVGVAGMIIIMPLILFLFVLLLRATARGLVPPTAPYLLALSGMAIQANTFESILLLRLWVVIGGILALNFIQAHHE